MSNYQNSSDPFREGHWSFWGSLVVSGIGMLAVNPLGNESRKLGPTWIGPGQVHPKDA